MIPDRARGWRGWQRAGALAGILGVLWAVAGLRRIDPTQEFGVLEGRWFGGVASIEGRRFAFAPPGLWRWAAFPKTPVVEALPRAEEAMLPSADGSRFGLVGTATLRANPSRSRELAALGRSGLRGALVEAVRRSANDLGAPVASGRPGPTFVRAFQSRLAGELDHQGVTLVALAVEGFDHLLSDNDIGAVPPGAKVLVVGLDGADWEIVEPLLDAGRLPHLAKIVANGARAKLLTITPVLSPVVWTSIATGVEPARHGILDFLVTDATGRSEPVSSRERLVPTVWELLSTAGVPVGVTAWWATWPADPVNGYLVTDRVAYQLFGYRSDPRSAAGKTWPAEDYDLVRPRIVAPETIPWSEVQSYLEGPRRRIEEFDDDERKLLEEFRTLLASGKTYLDVALALRPTRDIKFEAVYFEGTDTVGHLFMSYRPPHLPGVDPRRFASFHSVVDRYYETADAMLGRLMEGREDWVVIVVSDHGFASDATRPHSTDSRIGHGAAADWHRRFGVLALSGPGIKAGVRIDEASVYDVAPTILALFHQPIPRSWPGRVLGEAFEASRLAEQPVRFRASDPVRAGAGGGDRGAGDDESRELREKLQSLGYVASTTSSPMTTKNNRGVALLAAGDFENAAAAFREAIADDPDEATLWVNLGIALRHSGRSKEARALFEKALSSPDARRAAGHQLGQVLLEAGDYPGAERALNEVLAREPGAAEVRNSLGLVLEAKGDRARAAREYAEAARLDPNAAEPRNNLGNIAKADLRFDDAARFYEDAISADPYFMGAYNNLALLYQERGDAVRAIELYGRALTKAPKNAVVLNNLASLYFATADYREAESLWRRASEADPNYPSPLNNLAGLAIAEGEFDKAEALLTRALALDRNYGDARINQALLARRRGDTESARRELDRAAGDPRAEGTARLQIGFLELDQGRPAEAVRSFEKARKIVGDRTDLLNALGESYARLGESRLAVAAWKRSLALDSRQARIGEMIAKLDKHD